jgi:hypothetical protein
MNIKKFLKNLGLEKKDLLAYELSFQNKIKNICERNSIVVKNYLYLKDLNKTHFYDPAHLNLKGANIFTKYLINDLNLK